MIPKHTPGPWTFIEADVLDDVDGPFTICDEAGNDLATFYSVDDSTVTTTRGQAIANATMAAAAPELLDVLLAVIRYGELGNADAGGKPSGNPMSKDVWQFPRHMLTELKSAIAKAGGQV